MPYILDALGKEKNDRLKTGYCGGKTKERIKERSEYFWFGYFNLFLSSSPKGSGIVSKCLNGYMCEREEAQLFQEWITVENVDLNFRRQISDVRIWFHSPRHFNMRGLRKTESNAGL